MKTGKPKTAHDVRRLRTEQPNDGAANLDQKSAIEIARLINTEDATVAAAVRRALPQIARAIDWVAAALRQGGRLIYVGAGTSRRIGALDAAECAPTFNLATRTVQFIIAGGPTALGTPAESSEDDTKLGRDEMARRKPGKGDVVVGIASSGRTPFTVAAIGFVDQPLGCVTNKREYVATVTCGYEGRKGSKVTERVLISFNSIVTESDGGFCPRSGTKKGRTIRFRRSCWQTNSWRTVDLSLWFLEPAAKAVLS